jgi:hypothetical protein
MTAVAGDFYQFVRSDNNHVGILVADVSGHGIPAALISSMIKVAMQSVAVHADDLAQMLGGLNRILSSEAHGQFASAAYVWIDTENRRSLYSAAGHPPLLCWRNTRGEMQRIESNGRVEKVWGDTEKPGALFVIRIHNDAGYIVFPHTHPMDENITVVQGNFALGMGRRFDRSALQPVGLGEFGFVPKGMAHFGWSKTELIIQVHGTAPFGTTLVDPMYELTDKGVFVLTSLLAPGRPTSSGPPECFALKIGAQVRGDAGEGIVVGARCSPANQITEYWIRKPNGERYWATLQELKPL